jgi:alpha-1,4-digalacturonate transport system substrate-binding protein
MSKRNLIGLLVVVALALTALVPAVMAQDGDDEVTLRIMWYDDGNESGVLRDLLDRFEADHPGINVEIDIVAYADLHTVLQAQIEGGDPPDMARVTNMARFKEYYLDMTPYVEDPDYWLANFPEAVLDSMREDPTGEGLYGYPTQFTVTGPYINRTLFEDAGVAVPIDEKDEVTWDEWEAAAVEVAEATGTPYAMAIDRSGHRFWGPSLSLCATYVNEDSTFTVDSEGFRTAAEMIIGWHEDEITPLAVWAGSGGEYAAANEYFINSELVFYMSGSWQVGQFAEKIGDDFAWEPIPNPSGPCGATGIPGGAVMVAMESTEYPEEVSMVMDYLASQDVLGEFSAQTLFIPGHIGLAQTGVDYISNADELNVFLGEIPKLMPEAYALQYHPYTFVLNTAIRDRVTQVIVDELTLDEAIQKIQETVDEAMAEE